MKIIGFNEALRDGIFNKVFLLIFFLGALPHKNKVDKGLVIEAMRKAGLK
jgi:hypothetical protein